MKKLISITLLATFFSPVPVFAGPAVSNKNVICLAFAKEVVSYTNNNISPDDPAYDLLRLRYLGVVDHHFSKAKQSYSASDLESALDVLFLKYENELKNIKGDSSVFLKAVMSKESMLGCAK